MACLWSARASWSPAVFLGAALLVLSSVMASADEQQQTICDFPLIESTLSDYRDYLDGRDPYELAITDLRRDNFDRHNMELLIFQRAVKEGNCWCRAEYSIYPLPTIHARSIANVKAGRDLSHPIAGFDNDPRYAEGLLLSRPILSADEFFVGLYTDANRDDVLSLTDPEDIRALNFAVADTWVIDNLVIDSYGFTKTQVDSMDAILGLITLGRADVIMQPFNASPDFSFSYEDTGETYKPIPNIKLRFGSGRRYFVSAAHPQGEEFLNCLNAGLTKLDESGFLAQANIDAGVTDTRVADWQILE